MSNYHPNVPFTSRPRSPDVGEAIERVKVLNDQIAMAFDPRVRERAEAITEALLKGATLRELGKILQVSPETVRKWGEMK